MATPVPINVDDLLQHHPHQQWRQAGRRLVQQEQEGIEHEGPGHGDHLPLATAEMAGTQLALLAQVGKERIHFGLFRTQVPAANEGTHV